MHSYRYTGTDARLLVDTTEEPSIVFEALPGETYELERPLDHPDFECLDAPAEDAAATSDAAPAAATDAAPAATGTPKAKASAAAPVAASSDPATTTTEA